MEQFLKKYYEIEREFTELLNKKIGGYEDIGSLCLSALLNNVVELIKYLSLDENLFNLSYLEYINSSDLEYAYTSKIPFFLPHYYFSNYTIHDSMIWEKLLIIIAILYEIRFSDTKKKGLFEDIKKNENIDNEIKSDLNLVNSDYKMKKLSEIRKENDHYISEHLKEIHEKDASKCTLDEMKKKSNDVNMMEMEKLKAQSETFSKKQNIYIKLLKKCIDISEVKMKTGRIDSVDIEFLIPQEYLKSIEDYKVDDIKVEQIRIIEKNIGTQIKKLEEVTYTINSDSKLCSIEGVFERNTLLMDCLHRMKDLTRTLHLFYYCKTPENLSYDYENDLPEYYYYTVLLRMYSVYEKMSKFILLRYDKEGRYNNKKHIKGNYSKTVIEWLEKNKICCILTERYAKCLNSEEYKKYNDLRNKEYHLLSQKNIIFMLQNGAERFEKIKKYNIRLILSLLEQLYEVLERCVCEEREIFCKIKCR